MPSSKILEQKQATVCELVEVLKKSSSGVLVDYKGISVLDDTKLRASLRNSGVQYKVVKNTLLALAIKEVGLDGLAGSLSGTTALAVNTTDELAAAKLLCGFAKKNDKFTIKGGFMDGQAIEAESVIALSKIPSKEVLIAQVLFGLNSCISGLAIALDQIVQKKSAEVAE